MSNERRATPLDILSSLITTGKDLRMGPVQILAGIIYLDFD